MILTPDPKRRVFGYPAPVDLRKGYNGLFGLVEQGLKCDPMCGDLYLFVNEARKLCKILVWDGSGLCIFAKRLTLGTFAKLWRDYPHVQTVVPRVDFKTSLIRNLKFTHETELVRNVWDIDEPTHDEDVETQSIDMVLVPGLCFDSSGHRVGYGKGFYDRFLKTCRADCVKIGLSYFEPVDAIFDVHDEDVRLNFIITPALAFTIPV